MAQAHVPNAGEKARRALAPRWQEWVKTILIDHRDDPLLVEVSESEAADATR